MKTKNIYKLGMVLSGFFGIFPLFLYISANIMSYSLDCSAGQNIESISCSGGNILASLYVWSWFIIVTLPIGFILFLVFLLLYFSVRRR